MGAAHEPRRGPSEAAGAGGGGVELSGDELTAILCLDHGYPLHLMPHLNRYLARQVFLSKRRDRAGNLILRGRPGRVVSAREEFAQKWRAFGLAEHRITALWRRQFGDSHG